MNHYDVCLLTIPGRDIQRRPRRALAHLPFYDTLVAMADEYDRLKAAGMAVAARSLKEEASQMVDRWFEESDARADLDAEEMEQVAAARAAITVDIDPACGF